MKLTKEQKLEIAISIFEGLDFPPGYTFGYDNGWEQDSTTCELPFYFEEQDDEGNSLYGNFQVEFNEDGKVISVSLYDEYDELIFWTDKELRDFNELCEVI